MTSSDGEQNACIYKVLDDFLDVFSSVFVVNPNFGGNLLVVVFGADGSA